MIAHTRSCIDLRPSNGCALKRGVGLRIDTDEDLLFGRSVGRSRHTSIAITKGVYGHLMEGDRRSAAAAMSRALSGQ
ncbi:hypothetical protein NCC78_21385 [Micromonospora phytophila]|uniref:hypothetical protein n=1 Tax=Micromonospora phytophila TaxID=709888 RepID=UPI00202F97C0|nr:hypothetical protein [Micromonospora phytophila]MCM0677221.1 hypothetical protein [Micromonospora phytophila]